MFRVRRVGETSSNKENEKIGKARKWLDVDSTLERMFNVTKYLVYDVVINYIYIFWKLCSWIISWVAVEWYCDIALRKISRSSARINGVSSHEQYRDAKYFTRCSDISHPYVRYELYIESRNISCRANDYHRINCITKRDISFTAGRNCSKLKS